MRQYNITDILIYIHVGDGHTDSIGVAFNAILGEEPLYMSRLDER